MANKYLFIDIKHGMKTINRLTKYIEKANKQTFIPHQITKENKAIVYNNMINAIQNFLRIKKIILTSQFTKIRGK